MDESLLAELWERAEHNVPEDVARLALAACEGQEELNSFLGGGAARPGPPAPPEQPSPPAVWLRSVSVEGFRGIGPAQALMLAPGPGLTLVTGRNGSGKSSFAEALELVLTGTSERWAARSKVWRDGWRNLHARQGTVIDAEFVVEGRPAPVRITRRWTADEQLDGGTHVVEDGEIRHDDLAALGWTMPLATYRPILSYNELGSMLTDDPSKLHDRLAALLGLEGLPAAVERLKKARDAKRRDATEVFTRQRELRQRLGAVDDERARLAERCLGTGAADLVGLEGLLGEEGGQGNAMAVLSALSQLPVPELEHVEAAAGALRQAAEQRRALGNTDAEAGAQRAGLLRDALRFHARHGGNDCPVCSTPGALSPDWVRAAEEEAERLERESRAVAMADAAVERRRREAMALLAAPPSVLARAGEVGIDAAELRERWEAWAATPEELGRDLPGLADHLEHAVGLLLESARQVQGAARAEAERRQDRWLPLARELIAWLPDARRAEANKPVVEGLEQARKWLQDTERALHEERFTPIEQACKRYCALLAGEQSGWRLGEVVLQGATTRRRVDLELETEGGQQAALAVLSQGELHALALSLFLPRATDDHSPFRFLVIDDPVQAMDPARVDQLAGVLAGVAKQRQVLVLTHDERLRDAVNRLQIEATLLDIRRAPGSRVTVSLHTDTVRRLLQQAGDVAEAGRVPDRLAARVVPGFCRQAVEIACAEAYRRRALAGGEDHRTVDGKLAKQQRLTERLRLLMGNDDEYEQRLEALSPGAGALVKRLNEGAHRGDDGDLRSLIDGARVLTKRLRTLA